MTDIALGTNDLDNLKKGTLQVEAVYQGTTLVWPQAGAVLRGTDIETTGGGIAITENNVPIGPATADRYVILAIHRNGVSSTTRPQAATINGLAMMPLAVLATTEFQSTAIFISEAPIATGTTANFIVNYFSNVSGPQRLWAWSLTGRATESAQGERNTSSNQIVNQNIQGKVDAVVIGITASEANAAASWVWSDAIGGDTTQISASANDLAAVAQGLTTTAIFGAVTVNRQVANSESSMCIAVIN